MFGAIISHFASHFWNDSSNLCRLQEASILAAGPRQKKVFWAKRHFARKSKEFIMGLWQKYYESSILFSWQTKLFRASLPSLSVAESRAFAKNIFRLAGLRK